ncbi:DDHD domain-containing protein [Lasiosphaeria miniovina]|uniref:DDHD domain-containing protein n=1 Tax=Lasiosphaeria miniovina TaxID=1954250 RepID=A0AA40DQ69_9PEZI|nr:DDHD domain-containing protein [Lasiosphaeria miniovina]KAK0709401.1 DDHD domain-containing protein [Lasiosphaeria miniovina]
MAPGTGDKKAEKSYLASAVDSFNPWSRNSSPTIKDAAPKPTPNPGDHTSNPFYGQSFKRYSPDCPPLNVQWFHAVDVPKRKPKFLKINNNHDDKKPPVQPKKFVAFSEEDSRALESTYQTRLQEIEDERTNLWGTANLRAGSKRPRATSSVDWNNTTLGALNDGEPKRPSTRVPVNEDFLFDVDIEERELAPAYWEGPVYEVRRGSWFYQEGSTLRPCEENLASQLEEGYLKVKPWQYPAPARTRSNSAAQKLTPKPSSENLKAATPKNGGTPRASPVPQQHQPQTHRLFGTYMNNIATYQDSNTAWLSSDGMLSWVTSTVYEKFAGGGFMSGVKLVRGYTESKKTKEEKRPSTPTGTASVPVEQDEKTKKALKRRSAPARSESGIFDTEDEEPVAFESTQARLTRQFSNLIEGVHDSDEEAEAIRKREETEILDDYNPRLGETQGRNIEHLVLVTHGIGQLLGLRMESVNFVHDVNVLRKTMKSVYSTSADLRALNSEADETGPGNCRVQVLPVVWRHLLDFPKRKKQKAEHDLGETADEEDDYPSLEDITIEGVAFARSLISDLALDVLLYQSAYREQIAEIVLKESNRIYKLFMDRNPEFKGKVHIVGHSLGSAIMFDILCRQRERSQEPEPTRNPLRFWPSQDRYESRDPKDLAFNFDVDDFYCLGSPIGLFQMLKGRTISARNFSNALPSESPLNPEYLEDPFLSALSPNSHANQNVSPVTGLPYSVSSPKAAQLFNIFHPSDPISYRIEPLISRAMSALKPQILPYTKKGIFGSVTPGITGIGAKVGQSVSGLWSSLSSGIASSLLNRSLGLTQEDVASITASQQQNQNPSPGAGTNISAGVITDKNMTDAMRSEKAAERKRQLAMATGGGVSTTASGNEATLIDDELETLFSRFQKTRAANSKDKAPGEDGPSAEARLEDEQKSQKLRREETKVRALNRNGRVDYCIQESVLDFNPINTIASHMSYWGDEDISHFVLSQMLSSKARTPRH